MKNISNPLILFYLDKILEVYKWDPVKGWQFLGSPKYNEGYFSDQFNTFWQSRDWEDCEYHFWVTESSAFSHARVILMWLRTLQWLNTHQIYTSRVSPILDIEGLTDSKLSEIIQNSSTIDRFTYARKVRIG